jgi:antitoxin MazE
LKVKVKKWGNRASVRIPASVIHAVRPNPGEELDEREEAEGIVNAEGKKKTYDLRKLLKGITLKNQHEFIDFGPAVGKEALPRSIK